MSLWVSRGRSGLRGGKPSELVFPLELSMIHFNLFVEACQSTCFLKHMYFGPSIGVLVFKKLLRVDLSIMHIYNFFIVNIIH